MPEELTTPCMSTFVDGAARGLLLGIAWGAVFDMPPLGFIVEQQSPQQQAAARLPKNPPLTVRRGPLAVCSSMARSSLGFAAFLGVYNISSCSIEKLRGGAKDFINPLFGGVTAGAVMGLPSRNPRSIMWSAAGTGVITAGVTLLTGGSAFGGGKSS